MVSTLHFRKLLCNKKYPLITYTNRQFSSYNNTKCNLYSQQLLKRSEDSSSKKDEEQTKKNDGEPAKKTEDALEPPTTCCMSNCPNCVWVEYAQKLSEHFKDGGERAVIEIEKNITDPSLKAYILMEIRIRKKYG